MKKLLYLLILIPSIAFASNQSNVSVRGYVDNGSTKTIDSGTITSSFTTGAIQTQVLTLTANAFNAITVPSGAKAILIDTTTSQRGMILKGATNDNGISLDTAVPTLIPITADTSATVGIKNLGGATTVTIYFF